MEYEGKMVTVEELAAIRRKKCAAFRTVRLPKVTDAPPPPPIPKSPYQVELMWNREFDWVSYGPPIGELDKCIASAKATEQMGDGACVKKTRVVDSEGQIIWSHGKLHAALPLAT